mmetsp:Transcript_11440/g.15840  ORF Transcript_11440/g.15840 Transcript_11440/m.15840 type:complete len:95 (+) Transcript_11440:361-645(+)
MAICTLCLVALIFKNRYALVSFCSRLLTSRLRLALCFHNFSFLMDSLPDKTLFLLLPSSTKLLLFCNLQDENREKFFGGYHINGYKEDCISICI